MRNATARYLAPLLRPTEGPCVSLYQPTIRERPQHQQDPIRFKNLVKTAETALSQRYLPSMVRPVMEKVTALAGNIRFWEHTRDGLAVLASPNVFQVYHLQRPVKEQVVVADTFHVKPLLRYLQSADRFQVLGLTREEAFVWEGNRYVLDPLDEEPGTLRMTELLGDQVTEPHITVTGGPGGIQAGHGQGSKKDEADVDLERFFRAVDRIIIEKCSKPSGLPLMLFGDAELQTAFRRLSHNSQLVEPGIPKSPLNMPSNKIRELAWQALLPLYEQRLATITDDFRVAESRKLGSADISDVARAAKAGRVGRLLVEAERDIPGRIDDSGAIRFAEPGENDINDITNDLAESVLRNGGEVIIVPSEKMPTKTGIAAVYRF